METDCRLAEITLSGSDAEELVRLFSKFTVFFGTDDSGLSVCDQAKPPMLGVLIYE